VKHMKPTRDPITGYPAIEMMDRLIVLRKDVTLEEALEKPATEVVECAI